LAQSQKDTFYKYYGWKVYR